MVTGSPVAASKPAARRESSDFAAVLLDVKTSLDGLRQECAAAKQLSGQRHSGLHASRSSSGSSAQPLPPSAPGASRLKLATSTSGPQRSSVARGLWSSEPGSGWQLEALKAELSQWVQVTTAQVLERSLPSYVSPPPRPAAAPGTAAATDASTAGAGAGGSGGPSGRTSPSRGPSPALAPVPLMVPPEVLALPGHLRRLEATWGARCAALEEATARLAGQQAVLGSGAAAVQQQLQEASAAADVARRDQDGALAALQREQAAQAAALEALQQDIEHQQHQQQQVGGAESRPPWSAAAPTAAAIGMGKDGQQQLAAAIEHVTELQLRVARLEGAERRRSLGTAPGSPTGSSCGSLAGTAGPAAVAAVAAVQEQLRQVVGMVVGCQQAAAAGEAELAVVRQQVEALQDAQQQQQQQQRQQQQQVSPQHREQEEQHWVLVQQQQEECQARLSALEVQQVAAQRSRAELAAAVEHCAGQLAAVTGQLEQQAANAEAAAADRGQLAGLMQQVGALAAASTQQAAALEGVQQQAAALDTAVSDVAVEAAQLMVQVSGAAQTGLELQQRLEQQQGLLEQVQQQAAGSAAAADQAQDTATAAAAAAAEAGAAAARAAAQAEEAVSAAAGARGCAEVLQETVEGVEGLAAAARVAVEEVEEGMGELRQQLGALQGHVGAVQDLEQQVVQLQLAVEDLQYQQQQQQQQEETAAAAGQQVPPCPEQDNSEGSQEGEACSRLQPESAGSMAIPVSLLPLGGAGPSLAFAFEEPAAMQPSSCGGEASHPQPLAGHSAAACATPGSSSSEEVSALAARVEELEGRVAAALPLDGLTLGAVEARLGILEEDYLARAGLGAGAGPGAGLQGQQLQEQAADVSTEAGSSALQHLPEEVASLQQQLAALQAAMEAGRVAVEEAVGGQGALQEEAAGQALELQQVRDALARLQAQLTQQAQAAQQQQQQEQAAAAAAAAEAAASAAGPEGGAAAAAADSSGTAGWEAGVDALGAQLWELRVELQNEVAGLSERLEGMEGMRGDMDIWGDSLKAVAARAEVSAAEALEKVEAVLEQLAAATKAPPTPPGQPLDKAAGEEGGAGPHGDCSDMGRQLAEVDQPVGVAAQLLEQGAALAALRDLVAGLQGQGAEAAAQAAAALQEVQYLRADLEEGLALLEGLQAGGLGPGEAPSLPAPESLTPVPRRNRHAGRLLMAPGDPPLLSMSQDALTIGRSSTDSAWSMGGPALRLSYNGPSRGPSGRRRVSGGLNGTAGSTAWADNSLFDPSQPGGEEGGEEEGGEEGPEEGQGAAGQPGGRALRHADTPDGSEGWAGGVTTVALPAAQGAEGCQLLSCYRNAAFEEGAAAEPSPGPAASGQSQAAAGESQHSSCDPKPTAAGDVQAGMSCSKAPLVAAKLPDWEAAALQPQEGIPALYVAAAATAPPAPLPATAAEAGDGMLDGGAEARWQLLYGRTTSDGEPALAPHAAAAADSSHATALLPGDALSSGAPSASYDAAQEVEGAGTGGLDGLGEVPLLNLEASEANSDLLLLGEGSDGDGTGQGEGLKEQQQQQGEAGVLVGWNRQQAAGQGAGVPLGDVMRLSAAACREGGHQQQQQQVQEPGVAHPTPAALPLASPPLGLAAPAPPPAPAPPAAAAAPGRQRRHWEVGTEAVAAEGSGSCQLQQEASQASTSSSRSSGRRRVMRTPAAAAAAAGAGAGAALVEPTPAAAAGEGSLPGASASEVTEEDVGFESDGDELLLPDDSSAVGGGGLMRLKGGYSSEWEEEEEGGDCWGESDYGWWGQGCGQEEGCSGAVALQLSQGWTQAEEEEEEQQGLSRCNSPQHQEEGATSCGWCGVLPQVQGCSCSSHLAPTSPPAAGTCLGHAQAAPADPAAAAAAAAAAADGADGWLGVWCSGGPVLRLVGGAPSGSEEEEEEGSSDEGEGEGAGGGPGAWRGVLTGRQGGGTAGALVAASSGGRALGGAAGGLSFKERLQRVRRAGLLGPGGGSSSDDEAAPAPAGGEGLGSAARQQQHQQGAAAAAEAQPGITAEGAAAAVAGSWGVAVEAASGAGQQLIWVYCTTAGESGAGTTARVSLCWQDPATGRHQERQLSLTPTNYTPGTTTATHLLLPSALALPLLELVVGHDGAGYSGAWRLTEVVLVRPQDGCWWRYPHAGWLRGGPAAAATLHLEGSGSRDTCPPHCSRSPPPPAAAAGAAELGGCPHSPSQAAAQAPASRNSTTTTTTSSSSCPSTSNQQQQLQPGVADRQQAGVSSLIAAGRSSSGSLLGWSGGNAAPLRLGSRRNSTESMGHAAAAAAGDGAGAGAGPIRPIGRVTAAGPGILTQAVAAAAAAAAGGGGDGGGGGGVLSPGPTPTTPSTGNPFDDEAEGDAALLWSPHMHQQQQQQVGTPGSVRSGNPFADDEDTEGAGPPGVAIRSSSSSSPGQSGWGAAAGEVWGEQGPPQGPGLVGVEQHPSSDLELQQLRSYLPPVNSGRPAAAAVPGHSAQRPALQQQQQQQQQVPVQGPGGHVALPQQVSPVAGHPSPVVPAVQQGTGAAWGGLTAAAAAAAGGGVSLLAPGPLGPALPTAATSSSPGPCSPNSLRRMGSRGSGAAPLDDVELKHRGSPRVLRGSASGDLGHTHTQPGGSSGGSPPEQQQQQQQTHHRLQPPSPAAAPPAANAWLLLSGVGAAAAIVPGTFRRRGEPGIDAGVVWGPPGGPLLPVNAGSPRGPSAEMTRRLSGSLAEVKRVPLAEDSPSSVGSPLAGAGGGAGGALGPRDLSASELLRLAASPCSSPQRRGRGSGSGSPTKAAAGGELIEEQGSVDAGLTEPCGEADSEGGHAVHPVRRPTPFAAMLQQEVEAAGAAGLLLEPAEGNLPAPTISAAGGKGVAGEPPPLQLRGSVSWDGSRRAKGGNKAVRWSEWAEQVEFEAGSSSDSCASSVVSFTEEQLLEAQGEWDITTYEVPCPPGYETVMPGGHTGPGGSSSSRAAAQRNSCSSGFGSSGGARPEALTSAAGSSSSPTGRQPEGGGAPVASFDAVSLMASRRAATAVEYRLRLYTADRIAAALPGGQVVHVELCGSELMVAHALPRGPGTFQRGCVDSFTLLYEAGELGELQGVRVWHEPDGSSIGGGWCLDRVEVEHKLRGMRYRFPNTARDGWIQRGERRGVLLFRRQVVREGDEEAAAVEAEELRRQLATNEGLSSEDRALLVARLQALGAKAGRRKGSKG